jgi:hypothetical protein
VWLTYAAVQLPIGLRFGTQVVRTRRICGLTLDAGLAALVVVVGLVLTVVEALVPHPLIAGFAVMGALSGGRRLFVLLRPSSSPMAWRLFPAGIADLDLLIALGDAIDFGVDNGAVDLDGDGSSGFR